MLPRAREGHPPAPSPLAGEWTRSPRRLRRSPAASPPAGPAWGRPAPRPRSPTTALFCPFICVGLHGKSHGFPIENVGNDRRGLKTPGMIGEDSSGKAKRRGYSHGSCPASVSWVSLMMVLPASTTSSGSSNTTSSKSVAPSGVSPLDGAINRLRTTCRSSGSSGS